MKRCTTRSKKTALKRGVRFAKRFEAAIKTMFSLPVPLTDTDDTESYQYQEYEQGDDGVKIINNPMLKINPDDGQGGYAGRSPPDQCADTRMAPNVASGPLRRCWRFHLNRWAPWDSGVKQSASQTE